jgi:hypothetical protein
MNRECWVQTDAAAMERKPTGAMNRSQKERGRHSWSISCMTTCLPKMQQSVLRGTLVK